MTALKHFAVARNIRYVMLCSKLFCCFNSV